VFDAAGSVVADLLDGMIQGHRSKCKEIGGNDGLVAGGRRILSQPFGNDPAQQNLTGFWVVPKKMQGFVIHGFHVSSPLPGVFLKNRRASFMVGEALLFTPENSF
jgi:hypothetical protein